MIAEILIVFFRNQSRIIYSGIMAEEICPPVFNFERMGVLVKEVTVTS